MTTITTTAARELISHADGFTLPLHGSPNPDSGYYVGGVAPSLTTTGLPTTSQINAYLATFPHADYVGIWTDSASHLTYVDVVEHYEDRASALTAASQRGEIAIWNIADAEEIRL